MTDKEQYLLWSDDRLDRIEGDMTAIIDGLYEIKHGLENLAADDKLGATAWLYHIAKYVACIHDDTDRIIRTYENCTSLIRSEFLELEEYMNMTYVKLGDLTAAIRAIAKTNPVTAEILKQEDAKNWGEEEEC